MPAPAKLDYLKKNTYNDIGYEKELLILAFYHCAVGDVAGGTAYGCGPNKRTDT
jgi:hypothetical protein